VIRWQANLLRACRFRAAASCVAGAGGRADHLVMGAL